VAEEKDKKGAPVDPSVRTLAGILAPPRPRPPEEKAPKK